MSATSVMNPDDLHKKFGALDIKDLQDYIEDGLSESEISECNEQALKAKHLITEYTALFEEEIREHLHNGITEGQMPKLNNRNKKKKDKALVGQVVKMYDVPAQGRSLNLLLIGRTGEGKSATGNLLLGKKVFHESGLSKSCTERTQEESCKIEGIRVNVVDSPGMCDTGRSGAEVCTEIAKIVDTFSEGIDGFLFVLSMGNPRFTKEQQDVFEKMETDMFGAGALQHVFVIFTHIDSQENVTSFNDWINKQDGSLLGDVLNNKLNRRVLAVNNNEKTVYGREIQRQQIIRMVVANTTGHRYSTKDFKEIQMMKIALEGKYPPHIKLLAPIVDKELSVQLHPKTYSEIHDMPQEEKRRIIEEVVQKVIESEGVDGNWAHELRMRVEVDLSAKIERLIDTAKWKQRGLTFLLILGCAGMLVLSSYIPGVGLAAIQMDVDSIVMDWYDKIKEQK